MPIIEDDPFGGVKDERRPNAPTSREVNDFHTYSDVDGGALAIHHTLGKSHMQAAYGDHNHNGINSLTIPITPSTIIFGTGVGQMQFAIKPSNTDRSSAGSATDDPDLTVPVLAGATYRWRAGIYYTHGGTGTLTTFDMVYGWTIPGSARNHWNDNRVDQAITTAVAVIRGLRDQGTGTPTTGIRDNAGVAFDSLTALELEGILINPSNSGNFTFKWGQSVSTASPALRVAQDSFIEVIRVA